jgi:predicted phage-related endonuclease
MFARTVIGLIVLALAAGSASAQGRGRVPVPRPPNPQQMLEQMKKLRHQQIQASIKQLQQQIAALRAQRKVSVESIRAYFNHLIGADKLNEKQLAQHLKALKDLRALRLKQAKTPGQKTAINQEFAPLLAATRKGERLDQKQIALLQQKRQQMVVTTEKHYDTVIHGLEQEIHALRMQLKG